MPLEQNLMGVGMPAEQARLLGNNPPVAITAAGTTTTDATVLLGAQRVVNATGTGADGIRLPTTTALFVPYKIINVSGASVKIYPSSGGTLNSGSADAALTMTTHKYAIFEQISNGVWVYNLTA